jgi:hypothetical protein
MRKNKKSSIVDLNKKMIPDEIIFPACRRAGNAGACSLSVSI